MVTDAAAVYAAVLDELIPRAWHHVEQYANNSMKADHGRLKHNGYDLTRALATGPDTTGRHRGRCLHENLRCGHYKLRVDALPGLRIAAAFTELAEAI